MHRSYSAIPLVTALALASGVAWAHTTGLSQSELVVGTDGAVDARLVFAAVEISAAASLDANHDGEITPAEIDAARPDLKKLVLDGVEVKADGRACPASFRGAEVTEADGLVLEARYACPPDARAIEATLFLLSELRPGHRHVALLSAGERSSQKLLSGTNRSLTLELPPAAAVRLAPSSGWRRTTAVVLAVVWTIGLFVLIAWRWRRGRRRKP